MQSSFPRGCLRCCAEIEWAPYPENFGKRWGERRRMPGTLPASIRLRLGPLADAREGLDGRGRGKGTQGRECVGPCGDAPRAVELRGKAEGAAFYKPRHH